MNKKLNDVAPSEWDRAARSNIPQDMTTEEGRQSAWEQFANVGLEAWAQPDGYDTEQDEDVVNNPDHYNTGNIECIEAIEESMSSVAYKGYLKGNSMKYLWRYDYKGKQVEDLQKCQWYLARLTQVVVFENEGE